MSKSRPDRTPVDTTYTIDEATIDEEEEEEVARQKWKHIKEKRSVYIALYKYK